MNREKEPGTSESRTVPWEKVYLFISSTFNDMHGERDFLVKKVFPRLAEWCERRKLRMVDVDLRWGVTEEEATRNKNVVEVCLKRIDECRPFFLCFLGQRYGWVPRREDLSAATLREFPGLGEAVDGQHSVTELEILHALVRPFHPEDRIESEGFHPARHAFFFLREDSYLEELPSEPAYLRRIYSDEAEQDDETRQFLLRKNRSLREETVRRAQRPTALYEAQWSQTAESPELALPLASPALLDENIARWRRLWREAAAIEVEGEEVGPEQTAKAKAFNMSLTRGRLTGFSADGDPLERVILDSLEAAITERFPDHAEVEERTDLQQELDQQDQFLFVSSEGFIRRQGDLDELDAYVEDDSDRLFVLTAPGGMGKSTLLANWIGRHQEQLDREAGETLHYRFIGQSDGSTTVDSLLRLVLQELKETTGRLDAEIPGDPRELRQKWPELLKAVGKRGKTVLVLDALNQLESGLADLRWLPRRLPPGIKIVASFKRGEEEAERLFEELSGDDKVQLAEVQPFAGENDRKKLVEAYLSQYLKELDQRHLEELIRSEGAENPLFLKVVLSELRVFGTFASLGEKIRQDFGTDPVTAFDAVLARLERDPAYSAISPQDAVPLLFGLLAHARRGLSAEELTDLFVQVLKLEEGHEAREAAADTIYLFLRQVRPFLASRDGSHDFFYESFQIAARERFVGEATPEVPGRRLAESWHSLLADGFRSRSDPSGDGTWSGEPRGLAALPYHLTRAERFDELEATLLDFRFLQAKLDAFGPEPLIEDYDRGLAEGNDSSSLRLAGGAVRLSAHVLRRDPGQLPGQLWGRLDGDLSAIRRLLDHARGAAKRPWLRSVVPRLSAPGGPLLRTLEGHSEQVDSVAVLPDGRIVSGSSDGTLRVWDPDSGECLRTLKVDRWAVESVAVLPDGRVVSGSSDGTLRLWNPESGECLRTLEGDGSWVKSVAVLPDGRNVSGSSGHTLRVWDLESGECLRTLEGHSDYVTTVAVLPDGRIVSGSHDKTLRLWDPESGECLRTLEGHSEQVDSVAVLPDSRIVSGSHDKTLRLWDPESGECLRTLKGHSESVYTVAVLPDGRIVSGSCGGTLRLWDPESGECLRTLEGHGSWVRSVAVLPDCRIVSGSNDNTLRLWDPESGECLRTLKGHSESVYTVAVLPDGRIVSGSRDKTLRVWDPESGKCLRTLEGHSESVNTVTVLPDGRIVSGSRDKTLRVWNPESGECLHSLEGHRWMVNSVAVLPDCRIVSGSNDYTPRVWDPESGECLLTLEGHSSGVESVAVLPDGRIVSGSDDKTLRVWDPENGDCLHTLRNIPGLTFARRREGHGNSVRSVAVLPDGRIVSGSDDKTLRIWDPESGECLRTLEGHTRSVESVAVLPDGRIVSGSWDKTLRVWDSESGECLRTLEGLGGSTVAVLPDGRIVSGSWDMTLRVWDPDSGEVVATLFLEAGLSSIAITPHALIAAGDEGGRVHFLRLEEPGKADAERGDGRDL